MVAAFVLDASVTAAWCFADEATPGSDALRESLTERRIVVPGLWHAENANFLLVAERRKRITPERCAELLELLDMLPTDTVDETDHLRGSVLRLARAHGLTIYDAIYLDVALRRRLPLATRDRKLACAAKESGVPLIET